MFVNYRNLLVYSTNIPRPDATAASSVPDLSTFAQ
jgi:hypothetical protein